MTVDVQKLPNEMTSLDGSEESHRGRRFVKIGRHEKPPMHESGSSPLFPSSSIESGDDSMRSCEVGGRAQMRRTRSDAI